MYNAFDIDCLDACNWMNAHECEIITSWEFHPEHNWVLAVEILFWNFLSTGVIDLVNFALFATDCS